MNVLALLNAPAPYLLACLREFKRLTNGAVKVYAWSRNPHTSFEDSLTDGLDAFESRVGLTTAQMYRSASAFSPDVVLVSGWRDSGYLRVGRRLRRQGALVIGTCDNQWRGTLRQRAASLISRAYLHPVFDVMWVPGTRQLQFARQLGFVGDRCWDGFYACDWPRFGLRAVSDPRPAPPYFLFVGRYVNAKGLDILATAYDRYRRRTAAPWGLVTAGTGPLRDELVAAGVEERGFVQPQSLPALMAGATAFVLPSRIEPWGVVLQEAAATGLPLIASHECGSAVHLVREGFSGFSVATNDPESLAYAMIRMHTLPAADRIRMGRAAQLLSLQYTPEIWAQQLLDGVLRTRAHRRPAASRRLAISDGKCNA